MDRGLEPNKAQRSKHKAQSANHPQKPSSRNIMNFDSFSLTFFSSSESTMTTQKNTTSTEEVGLPIETDALGNQSYYCVIA